MSFSRVKLWLFTWYWRPSSINISNVFRKPHYFEVELSQNLPLPRACSWGIGSPRISRKGEDMAKKKNRQLDWVHHESRGWQGSLRTWSISYRLEKVFSRNRMTGGAENSVSAIGIVSLTSVRSTWQESSRDSKYVPSAICWAVQSMTPRFQGCNLVTWYSKWTVLHCFVW
mgnify:CR=1 FL=1